jgi:chromosome segregation ATPase
VSVEELHPEDPSGPAVARGAAPPDEPEPFADVPGHVALRSPVDALAQAALATIRDVTNEVARLARDAATRATDGTPIASLVRSLLGTNGTGPHGDHHVPDTATWSARLTNAETALAVAVQRATELEERLDRAIANLRETRDREQALQAELAATLERSAAEREAVSRRAEELASGAEQQRATAVREAEAARMSLAELQQSSLAQRNELSLARSEVARITASAEEAQQARERLDVDVRALRTRLGESQDRLRAAEVEIARLTEAHRRLERSSQTENANREARWEDQVASLRLEHTRERDRAQALAEELERQRVEARVREKREQRLQEELHGVATRADADREETVHRAQEIVQAAECARAAAAAELETLRASLSSDRARLEQMRAEQERVEQGVAQREAALANVTQLETSRATAAAELERTRARLAETETELLTVQHEHRLAQRQLDKLCTAHDDLVEDHARVSAFLADARATETTLRTQTDELRDQIRALESERFRLRESERLHSTTVVETHDASERATTLERELQSLRGWGRMLEDEVAQATLSLEQGAVRERRLQDALAASEQSMADHDETLRQAQALTERAEQERAAVVAEIESLRTAMASAQRVIMEAEEDTRVARAEAERLAVVHEASITEKERAETLAGTPAPKPAPGAAKGPTAAPPAVAVPVDTRLVAILDTGGDWAATGGAEIIVVRPDEQVVSQFGAIEAGRCVVNLAAPGAIAAAAALRAAGVPIALWGTIFAADADRGLSLGQIEVLTRPIDADLVRSQCVTIAPKSARILAIGSDSSTFIGLRQGLMKAGMSVSIAWDLKQATELMEIVRPHMIVLDLALPSRGAAALVTQLARVEKPPVLVLLPGSGEQLTAFGAAAGKLVPAEGARSHANILRSIVETKGQ